MCSCSFSVLHILLLLQTLDSHRSDLVCPMSMFPSSGYVPGHTSQTPVCLSVPIPVLFLFCFYIGLTRSLTLQPADATAGSNQLYVFVFLFLFCINYYVTRLAFRHHHRVRPVRHLVCFCVPVLILYKIFC